ncbi:MAG TPA: HAMP domain-containing sensor histidine kinase, partial [Thermoanaerobaculia bacterium]|nr:HAMP domain-containing sensor histidine kinase [Thermoanaerobaculia bacterium]
MNDDADEAQDPPGRRFVERMAEGAVVAAADGAIRYANPSFAALVGRRAGELLGLPLLDLVDPVQSDAVRRLLAHGRERAVRGAADLAGADGGRVPAWLSVAPLPEAGPGACAVVVGDRREERALAREESARREAEAANLAKDQFLSVLSHELRTPLNAILGWAQLLSSRDDVQPEQAVRGLAVIERNARAQTQLIDDLLDISRIVAGKLRLELRRVRIGDVVEAALAAVAPAAAARGVRVEAISTGEEETVLADPDRLQQVVWNLLSNAVKYTPAQGRVTVQARRDGDAVEVRVEDTGEGIDPETLPKLFQLFEQGDSGATRRSTGLGLGLAIVRHLAELHGGSAAAESAGPGRGSTFLVRLPLAREDPGGESDPRPASEPAAPPAPSPDLSGL